VGFASEDTMTVMADGISNKSESIRLGDPDVTLGGFLEPFSMSSLRLGESAGREHVVLPNDTDCRLDRLIPLISTPSEIICS
jgi:hypothetical protein